MKKDLDALMEKEDLDVILVVGLVILFTDLVQSHLYY